MGMDSLGRRMHTLAYSENTGKPREPKSRIPVRDKDGKVHLVYPIDAREWIVAGVGELGELADISPGPLRPPPSIPQPTGDETLEEFRARTAAAAVGAAAPG